MIVYGKDRPNSTPLALLCSHVLVGDGCWEWQGYRNRSGYGAVRVGGRGGKLWLAHRLSYSVLVGPIVDNLHVLHRCDNPRCVRPDHLFLGTNEDNVADRIAKGRPGGAQTWKVRRVGEAHPLAKLSNADVEQIREMYGRGESTRSIAERFGIRMETTWRIATGRDRRLPS